MTLPPRSAWDPPSHTLLNSKAKAAPGQFTDPEFVSPSMGPGFGNPVLIPHASKIHGISTQCLQHRCAFSSQLQTSLLPSWLLQAPALVSWVFGLNSTAARHQPGHTPSWRTSTQTPASSFARTRRAAQQSGHNARILAVTTSRYTIPISSFHVYTVGKDKSVSSASCQGFSHFPAFNGALSPTNTTISSAMVRTLGLTPELGAEDSMILPNRAKAPPQKVCIVGSSLM